MIQIPVKTVAAAMVGLGVFFAPVAASAQANPAGFGQHVRHCAQTMGFSGGHNPGLHQGAAAWNGESCRH